MIRREFIAGLGSAVAWPLVARAQKRVMPVVGFLDNAVPQARRRLFAAFLPGLAETGYVDGRNVSIVYRWAEYHADKLPELALELVRHGVDVIASSSSSRSALAAKSATQNIPIVFLIGNDPVRGGLVASLARPGGNCTGVTLMTTDVDVKRLELLHELAPAATTIGLLINRNNPAVDGRELRNVAHALGIDLLFLDASGPSDLERAFTTIVERRIGAILISTDNNLFQGQTNQIVALAADHGVPAMYARPESAVAGGLITYGSEITDLEHQFGAYIGRILNGEKPADLPVQRPTKFRLVINLKTARSLGIDVPTAILLRADEVIE